MPLEAEFFTRSALERDVMVSYAGNREDVRLRRVHQLLPGRTYVDVGAGHPVDGSVTYWLYTQGWRGVLVEPGTREAEIAARRPEDRVLAAAVGSGDGDGDGVGMVLYETSPDPGMSTLRQDRLEELQRLDQTWVERAVPVVPLSQVFQHVPGDGHVALLSVDVEGAEADVLGTLDWERQRPALVVVESIEPWRTVSTHASFEPVLLTAGYRLATFDGVNRYYVDEQLPNADLLSELLDYPLSVLDRYTTAESRALEEEAARLKSSADELFEDRERLAREITELSAAHEASRRELEQEVARHRAELEHVRRALEAAVQAQHELREQQEMAVARLQQANAELQARHDLVLASRTWRYGSRVAHQGRTILGPALPALRRANTADEVSAVLRRRLASAIRHGRARLAGPDAVLAAVVADNVDPAFLRPDGGPVAGTPAGGWLPLADAQARDSDTELRSRLERRAGIRDDDERDVQVAALAVAARERGKAHRPRRGGGHAITLFDGRCLQDQGLATRGVGQYARQMLEALLEAERMHDVVVLLDERLPRPSVGLQACDTTHSVDAGLLARITWFVQPSPMTATAWPLTGVLNDAGIWSTALLHDVIPALYPSAYLADRAAKRQYYARLEAVGLYDELWSNSHATLLDYGRLVPLPATTSVVWTDTGRHDADAIPADIPELHEPYVLLAGGDERRKNVVGGIAAVAAARSKGLELDVALLGWSGEAARVRQWTRSVGLPDDVVHVLPYVSDDQAAQLRASALVCLVPSFAEGLSLPVLEAVADGCPVVASRIPAHRELLGDGPWLADPTSPVDLLRALQEVQSRREGVVEAQARCVEDHRHVSVSDAVQSSRGRPRPAPARPRRSRPSVGVVTPWPPQRSGIADYSAATIPALADHVDLSLWVSGSARPPHGLARRATPADPALGDHDVLLTVLGNSHFHLPGLEIVESYGGVALCHDVRMNELNSYLGLERPDRGPSQQHPTRTRRHELDAAPSLGFGHVAQHCDRLLFHSRRAATRVHEETGRPTIALPFVPYRFPTEPPTAVQRAAARSGLGLAEDVWHVGLLGGVDMRTKAADVVVEALAWLRTWGHPVRLHVVGGVEPTMRAVLDDVARWAAVDHLVHWHGHVSEVQYRDFLLGLDAGVQLRTAELLSLSGAAADMAAFGLPSVATSAMAEDMQLPAFVHRVPDDFSPLIVAEALLLAVQQPRAGALEDQRREYVHTHSVKGYAAELMRALEVDRS